MLLHLLSVFLLTGLTIADPKNEPPKWSDVYSVKGVLYIPAAELKEPFQVWYNQPYGASRIDYYDGMVETYQLTSDVIGDFGSSYKIVPVTTEEQLNKHTCFQVKGTNETATTIQSILPDLTGFRYSGEEVIRGDRTQKWKLEENYGEKTNEYIMWIKYTKPCGETVDPLPVPVRYEMLGYNTLLHSHYDHYHFDYEDYIVGDIPKEIFSLKPDMECSTFPGRGLKYLHTFNPMKEFIHPISTDHVNSEFSSFKDNHNKTYDDDLEHTRRQDIFRQNLRYVQSTNRANLTYTLSMNYLADRTIEETKYLCGKQFTTLDNGASLFPYDNLEVTKIVEKLPASWDWRHYGAVNPVKDQSVCGSCWSFSALGAVEGALFLHNGGHLKRLSPQALIDCSWGFGNNGCDGGEDSRGYQWIMKHGGVPLEDEYGPYLGQGGYCHANDVNLVAPITGYVNVTANDPAALRLAIVKHGPVSVGFDASHKSFNLYGSGIYYEPECGSNMEDLNHSMLAVGYGTLNGEDFWVLKNSWSTYWGNDGYILMAVKNNNCGVLTCPTYVTMEKKIS